MPNANLGNMIFVDQNNDNKLDAADVVQLGNRDPKWILGLGNTVSYKKFDLNVFVYGRFNQYMDNNYAGFYNPARIAGVDAQNTLVGISNVWSADRPNGTYPGIAANPYSGSNPAGATDFYQRDVSFLRLRNVSLGYTINAKKFVRSARLFLDIQNLGVLTNYEGYDPEGSAFGTATSLPGVDQGRYPLAKTYLVGLNIGF